MGRVEQRLYRRQMARRRLGRMIVLMLLNVFLFPSLLERQVVEVPYSQFLTMVDGGQVGGLLQDRRLAG